MMQGFTTSTTPIVHPPLQGPITATSVKPAHVVTFPAGLPGFEECRSFVLLATDDDTPLHYLTALDGPDASFLVIDPRNVQPGYKCDLTESDARRLGATPGTSLVWLSLVTIEGGGTVTANLRAPVVINPTLMIGHQVIPHQGTYPVRHVLVQGE
jgi:flagellar assembly factor FliW